MKNCCGTWSVSSQRPVKWPLDSVQETAVTAQGEGVGMGGKKEQQGNIVTEWAARHDSSALEVLGAPVLPQTADLKDHSSSIFTTTTVLLIAGIKSSKKMSGHIKKQANVLLSLLISKEISL